MRRGTTGNTARDVADAATPRSRRQAEEVWSLSQQRMLIVHPVSESSRPLGHWNLFKLRSAERPIATT